MKEMNDEVLLLRAKPTKLTHAQGHTMASGDYWA